MLASGISESYSIEAVLQVCDQSLSRLPTSLAGEEGLAGGVVGGGADRLSSINADERPAEACQNPRVLCLALNVFSLH